jgi:two-component system sensor histidine kinase/response regulator
LGQFNASLEHQVIERTKELRENNTLLQNFKRIIDTAHDSVISVDTDGNVTYWNPASRNAYGYTVQEVTGKQLQNFIIPTEKKLTSLTRFIKKVNF